MYVPNYDSIIQAIGVDRTTLERSSKVTIPVDLFKFLLQTALAAGEFNEAGYLEANPDVAAALRSGSMTNAHLHYLSYGYFEGRKGAMPKVDEQWYLTTYPDVAAAIKSGHITSAAEHFEIIGAAEGRSPNAQHQATAAQWKKVL